MADEKKIILSVGLDATQAAQGIDNLKTKLGGVNNTQIDKPFTSFKNEIKAATNEAANLQRQFGQNSNQFKEAAQRVATLKANYGDFSKTVQSFNPENRLQPLVSVARTATQTVQGLTAGMNLLGLEGSNTEKAILKLQSITALGDLLGQVDELKDGFKNLGTVLSTNSAFLKINNGLTVAATGIMKLLGLSVDTTSTSFKFLKGAIAATGIGLLVVGIAALIQNFDKLTDTLGFTNKEQKILNQSQEEFNKGVEEAAKNVSQVRIQFDLYKKGVISKEAALKTYNETLGESIGFTNDINVAETNLLKKADAYIKITGLKAQANALFALSAQETSKSILASTEDQTTFLDKTLFGIRSLFGDKGGAITDVIEAQADGVTDATKKYADNADLLKKKGEELLVTAGDLANQFGINLNPTTAPTSTAPRTTSSISNVVKEQPKIKFTSTGNEDVQLSQSVIDEEAIKAANDARIAEANRVAQAESDASTFATDVIIANELEKQRVTKATADARIETLDAIGNAVGALSDVIGADTVAGKAFAIAQGTISATLAGINAFNAIKTAKTPAEVIAAIALSASVLAKGLALVRQIKNVKVPGKGSGAGGSAPSIAAPSISATSTASQAIQDVRVTNSNQQQPIRAFIVDRDIQNNEERRNFLNSISTF